MPSSVSKYQSGIVAGASADIVDGIGVVSVAVSPDLNCNSSPVALRSSTLNTPYDVSCVSVLSVRSAVMSPGKYEKNDWLSGLRWRIATETVPVYDAPVFVTKLFGENSAFAVP